MKIRKLIKKKLLRKSSIIRGMPDNFFKATIEGNMVTQDLSRVSDTYVHVSDLVNGFCSRRHYLSYIYGVGRHRNLRSHDHILFATGRAHESLIRDVMSVGFNVSNFYGEWLCLCGRMRVVGHKPASDTKCDMCNTSAYRYDELQIVDDNFNVSAHPDLIYRYGDKYYILEIKSINAKNFADLTEAKADHILQCALYWCLINEQGTINLAPDFRILYSEKEYKFFGSPYKEFRVKIDPYLKQIKNMLNEAKQLKVCLDAETIPERVLCDSADCRLAKDCRLSDFCFSGDSDD